MLKQIQNAHHYWPKLSIFYTLFFSFRRSLTSISDELDELLYYLGNETEGLRIKTDSPSPKNVGTIEISLVKCQVTNENSYFYKKLQFTLEIF